MTSPQTSPRILKASWGRIEVEFQGRFKDVKLFPGGAREWDWNETGTRHSPGVQPADVEEILARGSSVVILGTGMLGRLKVMEDTRERLRKAGVELHVLRTEEAVRRYNRLREDVAVGALLHSTC